METVKKVKKILKSSPFIVRVYKKSYFPRIMGLQGMVTWLSLSGESRYAFFQKKYYEYFAAKSKYSSSRKKDSVVGAYEEHNEWKDYDDYLMRHVSSTSHKNKLALDFGCGPGRSIIKFKDKFKRIDGIDISENNIKNARENLETSGLVNTNDPPKLYVNNGVDLKPISNGTYDFVFSTICMQHICVHKTRFSIMKDMFRILKPKGRISIQMGFGYSESNNIMTVPYYVNVYQATKTNNDLDTRVEDPNQIKNDLEKIGFKQFEYWIRPTGPGDHHENWIFFTAVKP